MAQKKADALWETFGREHYIEHGEFGYTPFSHTLMGRYIRGEGGLIPPSDLSACDKLRETKTREETRRILDERQVIRPLKDNCVPYEYKETFKPRTSRLRPSDIIQLIGMSFSIQLKPVRSGGTIQRRKDDIIYNNLQGKLAEIIVYREHCPPDKQYKPIDYDLYERGKWDIHDIVTDDEKTEISVKSGLKFHNLLLLTHDDHDERGMYRHHFSRKEDVQIIYAFVRLDLSKKDILKEIKKGKEHFTRWFSEEYSCINYDVFFCSLDRIQGAIQKGNVIQKGAKLNGVEKMDATNYYILTYNMEREIERVMGSTTISQ